MRDAQQGRRRLAGAVGAVAAGLGAGQSAEAAVTVQNFDPPLEAAPGLDIDLGNDTVREFRLGVAIDGEFDDLGIKADSFAGTMHGNPPETWPGMAGVIMENGQAANLAPGTLIGPADTYVSPFLTRLNGHTNDTDGIPVGNFNDASGFIGVQFELNANTHYGYVGYEGDAGLGGDGRVFTIGWEDVPNTAVLAGNAPPGLATDYDGDNDVDGNDFLIWQRGLGTTHDADDLATWRTEFGQTAAAAAIGAVPEPGSLALLAMGAAGISSYRQRRGAASVIEAASAKRVQ